MSKICPIKGCGLVRMMEGKEYCYRHGAKLVNLNDNCPICKKEYDYGDSFCSYCGADLRVTLKTEGVDFNA